MAALLPALSLLLPLATAAVGTGLLMVGGSDPDSAEVWTAPPNETHCTLPDPARPDGPPCMQTPTVDTVEGRVLTCYQDSCLELTGSGLEAGPNMLHSRRGHTSAVTAEGLLLVGGFNSPTTTELLPAEGGPGREGFPLQPGRWRHCSIQLSTDTIVLTGGKDTESQDQAGALPGHQGLVTEYSGLGTGGEVTTRELPALLTPRYDHACGVYTVGRTQTMIVTGGVGILIDYEVLSSTEVMAHPAGSWREAGPLPSARHQLRGASLASVFHVSGGWDGYGPYDSVPEILAWDPVSETWSLAGHLTTARGGHGVTEVSLADMEGLCNLH